MPIYVVIPIILILLIYATMPYWLKPQAANDYRAFMKIVLMAAIVILTILDTEAISVDSLAVTMRSSVLYLAGIELIETVEEQIKKRIQKK